MEEEQDLMGLYQSELSRQIHLRNKQKREWESLKKKIAKDMEQQKKDLTNEQDLFEQEQRQEDLEEMRETEASKKLATAMLRSASGLDNYEETLSKAVDLLQNQNGNMKFIFEKNNTLPDQTLNNSNS